MLSCSKFLETALKQPTIKVNAQGLMLQPSFTSPIEITNASK